MSVFLEKGLRVASQHTLDGASRKAVALGRSTNCEMQMSHDRSLELTGAVLRSEALGPRAPGEALPSGRASATRWASASASASLAAA